MTLTTFRDEPYADVRLSLLRSKARGSKGGVLALFAARDTGEL